MRLLLDTHIFLWSVGKSERLKTSTRNLIHEADRVYVSAASILEIAIKQRTGKLDVDPDAMACEIEASGFNELPVSSIHAAWVARLERHHGDPFDRLLVAQADSEQLRLVTADRLLARYGKLALVV